MNSSFNANFFNQALDVRIIRAKLPSKAGVLDPCRVLNNLPACLPACVWLAARLVGSLAGSLAGCWLACSLACLLAGLFAGWLAGLLLAGRLAGPLAGLLASRLACLLAFRWLACCLRLACQTSEQKAARRGRASRKAHCLPSSGAFSARRWLVQMPQAYGGGGTVLLAACLLACLSCFCLAGLLAACCLLAAAPPARLGPLRSASSALPSSARRPHA